MKYAACDKLAKVRESILALNDSLDFYWNHERGFKLTGMGEAFVYQITNAQSLQKEALQILDELGVTNE